MSDIKKLSIALVEDDHEIRDVYSFLINKTENMNCVGFEDAESFMTEFKSPARYRHNGCKPSGYHRN